jgi:PAS domain S-box-containing protein
MFIAVQQQRNVAMHHTEYVRYWVIATLSVSCVLIAALGLSYNAMNIYQQLFFIPIIYASYFYPRRGIIVAGALGLIYQAMAYYFFFPDLNFLIYVTVQVIVFITVATIVSSFSMRIRDDEVRYRSIFESSPMGIMLVSPDYFMIRDANPSIAEMLRYTPDELMSKRIKDLFFDENEYQNFLKLIQEHPDHLSEFETRFLTRDGNPHWVRLSCTAAAGNQLACTVTNIHERRMAEEALTEVESSHSITLNAMSDPIHVVDDKCRIVQVNKAFLAWCEQYLQGIKPLGKRPWEICPQMKDRLTDEYQRVAKSGEMLVTVETNRFGDREVETETRKIPVIEQGRAVRIITVMRDMSERRVAERALRDSEYKYRQLADNSPISIIIAHHGIIHYANPTFCRLTGYRKEDLLGKKFSDLVHIDDRQESIDLIAKWESGRFVTTQKPIKFVRKNGETRRAELFVSSIQDSGEHAEMINLVDITQQILLEEKLRTDLQRRRDIITTVAHELRTPLQPIMGYLNLLIQDPDGFSLNEETKKIITLCLKNVDRERQIVNQMLELSILDSGRIRLKISEFSIASLVNSVVEAGGYQLQGEITNQISPDILVRADMDRLYVVLDSLLSNAVKYSKPPRKIRIKYFPNEHSHLIDVEDNGVGIEESSLSMIFEPFHLADAAKLSRKYDRIGLSLSIAKKYIQLHGGDITVRSKVGEGSTFTIVLPKELKYES